MIFKQNLQVVTKIMTATSYNIQSDYCNRKHFVFPLLFCLVFISMFDSAEAKTTAKQKYFKADAAYKKLKDNHKIRKYRHNWLSCIKKYKAVYSHDPSGAWAAAGLYKSGLLYTKLHKFSNKKPDLEEAVAIFQKVITLYPKSSYHDKSEKRIDEISNRYPSLRVSKSSRRPIFKSKNGKPQKKYKTTKPGKKKAIPGFRCIVIDPGHGGKDNGAPGYYRKVKEKDIVLDIAKKLKAAICRDFECDVVLTRSDDRFLKLDERSQIANKNNADLFISIHANASPNKDAYGTETYILSHASDKEAARVAARENNTSVAQVSDLQLILSSLMQNAKINESSQLAGYVQGSIYKKIKKEYKRVKDKGIKQAPFYVLLGAEMPAILVEVGFISNPMECKRLINPDYQDTLCQSILNGIKKYLKETHPTANLERKPPKKS